MNARTRVFALLGALLLIAAGCGGASKPAERPGVVYLDPNAAPAAKATEAPAPAQPVEAAPANAPEEGRDGDLEGALDLYFESRGVRVEPMMEAAPVLAALGEPLRSFEADSCAYLGKDVFYAYPGFELTVNQVEGVERITSIHVADDTVITPQGIRIYDEEEKLLSLLGGTEDGGVYTYRSGRTELVVQVKEAEDDLRRISNIEYRAAEDQ